ncbi:MAG: DUF1345 domain-containing protein [Gammaproteobacteria bacterium]
MKFSAVNRLNSIQKLVVSLVAGTVVYFAFSFEAWAPLPHLVFGWDVLCVCLLVLTWITFYTTLPREIRQQAKQQDKSQVILFFILLLANCVSMLAVILLLTSKPEDPKARTFQLVVGVTCMALSWFLVQTLFATRYANLYYADHATKTDGHAGGLDFPDESRPDFVDFAYFSITIGMTFQVSDVNIVTRRMRRLALWHSLLAFGYNVAVIALTVNIIAGATQP